MKKFIVRQSFDFNIVVEAENEADAIKQADKSGTPSVILDGGWEGEWSAAEVEEE